MSWFGGCLRNSASFLNHLKAERERRSSHAGRQIINWWNWQHCFRLFDFAVWFRLQSKLQFNSLQQSDWMKLIETTRRNSTNCKSNRKLQPATKPASIFICRLPNKATSFLNWRCHSFKNWLFAGKWKIDWSWNYLFLICRALFHSFGFNSGKIDAEILPRQ